MESGGGNPLLDDRRKIDRHYSVGTLLDSILQSLIEMGKDLKRLTPDDLAPIDGFHIRGREATVELANLAGFRQGSRVLDIGCGLGGSVRYLAGERQCQAMGLEVTREYVETARALAEYVGLSEKVQFVSGDALEIPFVDSSFDGVWTEHTQMNIGNKSRFHCEVARVLKPGGRFVFHDILQGEGGEPYYPLPWANDASLSDLATGEAVRGLLRDARLSILAWEDKSQKSLEWLDAVTAKRKKEGRSPLGLHLLMGENAKVKSQNQLRNLQEKRIRVVEALAEKV
jgi:SAM-dependent methyltransferase